MLTFILTMPLMVSVNYFVKLLKLLLNKSF